MGEFTRLIAGLLLGGLFVAYGYLWKEDQAKDARIQNLTERVENLQGQLHEEEGKLDSVQQEFSRSDEALKNQLKEKESKLEEAQQQLATNVQKIDATQSEKNAAKPPSPPAIPVAVPSPGVKPSTPTAENFDISKYIRFLVVIKGDKQSGSGFVLRLPTGPALITNAHVLSGNGTFTSRCMDGSEITMEKLRSANARDIVAIDSAKLSDGLELLDGIDTSVAIGDEVVVLGNSMGAGVATKISGKITGIGPDLVEVDAKFVSGNSGSPIVHVKTGKVIGIATYSLIRKLEGNFGRDSAYDNIERRFAYRLDNISAWQEVGWPIFSREGQILRDVQDRTASLLDLIKDMAKKGVVVYGKFLDPNNPLHELVGEFRDNMNRYSPRDLHYDESKREFLDDVADLSMQDIKALNPRQFSSYHAKLLSDEIEERNEMAGFFHAFNNWR